jgi:transposase
MSLTDFTKLKIISMFENKITQVKIAKKLKMNQSTVARIIAKFKKKTEHTQNIIPPGKPSKTSSSDFIALKKLQKKNLNPF